MKLFLILLIGVWCVVAEESNVEAVKNEEEPPELHETEDEFLKIKRSSGYNNGPSYAHSRPSYPAPAPYSAPAPSYQAPASSYSAPVPYQAPQAYSAPAPSYSQPSYSRPIYSKPVAYSAPAPAAYSAPAPYSAPASYSAPQRPYSVVQPGYKPAPSYGGYRTDEMEGQENEEIALDEKKLEKEPILGSSYGGYAPPSYSAPVYAGPQKSYSYPSPAPHVPCSHNILAGCRPTVAPVPCVAPSYGHGGY